MNNTVIEPASRIKNVHEYYFSGKLRQLNEMRQRGLDVINLGIGSPDLPPHENVISALNYNARNPENHGYQSYTGIPALRNAFSAWYKLYFNVDLDPSDEILPLVGSKEGIMHISMAFINEGDEVLIPNPGYPTYEAAARLAGGKVRYYDLTEETAWLPDLARLENEGVDDVKIMWINYPHMPTGRRATTDIFRSLVAFAAAHNILLCNDNPYSFILNEHQVSVFSAEGSMDVALELNSLSKSHNMSGWRIGMVAGNHSYINAILRVKSNMDSGMFQPLQAAAVEALNTSSQWYADVNDVYRKRRLLAEEIMNSLSCSFDSDQAGLFLWGRIPPAYKDSEELSDFLLQKTNVFITPGRIFGSNGDNYIRISLCSKEKVLSEARDRIVKEFETEI
ncbi:MAG: aminotransferase class I/II-fold pyridoxal phosphate-dependent enzyme [Bacteroidales bacterium]|nr:aminotransferase class I/II-fold pyridoxal phosphate-dependent enzyme [Bacteroidales bacterium]